MWLHLVDLSALEFGFEALAFLCSDKGDSYRRQSKMRDALTSSSSGAA